MIKLFYNLFNHNKIDELNRTIEIYKERNNQLEKENMEYKGYKLKYEVIKLYNDDDEALLELFEAAKKRDSYISECQSWRNHLANMARHQATGSAYGGLGGVANGVYGLFGGRY